MKNRLAVAALVALLCCRCSKAGLAPTAEVPLTGFKEFLIPQGAHYTAGNDYKELETAAVNFIVKFDSSAVYQTKDPANQYDINKLWGFADNGSQHHQYSARFGWRWSNGALRLFAYTYNNGVRAEKELGEVPIGAEINCGIEAAGERYLFLVNGKVEAMPRLSTTILAKGYQLYPYFGGDETAPHPIKICIKTN